MAESDLSNIKDLFFDHTNPANPMWTDGSTLIGLSPPDYLNDYNQSEDVKCSTIHDSYTTNDTLDINLMAHKPLASTDFPVSPIGPPLRTCFPGAYNFQVEINSADTHKKKYVYSVKLERLYVDAACDFPIHFKWDGGPDEMLVRACVIFVDQEQAEKQVETCPNHYISKTDPGQNVNLIKKWKNVLHSSRSEDTDGVYYCGDKNVWYSTVVKFDGRNENKSHAYRFVCKNSCSMGINRRSVGIIFTLENLDGTVCGRVQVGVRVCACPRRDMHKEEQEAAPAPPPAAAPRKRAKEPRAHHDHDDRLLDLPAFKVRGVSTAICGLESMVQMMELHKRKSTDQQMNAETEQHIQKIKTFLNKLKK